MSPAPSAHQNQANMHAAATPAASVRNSGTSREQRGSAIGHRVWKTHPDGGLIGLGISLDRICTTLVRSMAGFGTGTAESNARVYG
jgi:hypothetical protein